MLNKEMLSASQKLKPLFTHMVFVGKNDASTEIGYEANYYGDINPKVLTIDGVARTLKSVGVNKFLSGSTIKVSTESFNINSRNIWLGRADTKQNFGNPDVYNGESGVVDWWSGQIFSEADLNKNVPIYIADSPPPTKSWMSYFGGSLC